MNPFEPKTDDPAEYWLWLGQMCEYFHQQIPAGHVAQAVYADPDEHWKGSRLAREAEQECAPATLEFLQKHLTLANPPRGSAAVRHYTRLRLEFGQRQARLFATRCSGTERCPLKIPSGKNYDVLLWLLDDVYCAWRFEHLNS